VKYRRFHDWPTSKAEASAIQDEMAGQVELHGNIDYPKLIAAVDTSYGSDGEIVFAAAVVTSFPQIEIVEQTYHFDSVNFPYYPGLFYFREGPVIIEALAKITSDPELLIVHGHGLAHPRLCGMACHIGIVFDKPTIGCARKLLAGRHRPVGSAKGNCQPIVIRTKEVGIVYCSKDNVKPIIISPAYKCNLAQAKNIIVECLRGFRLPEPLRLAHLYANKYSRHMERSNVGKA